MYTEGHILPKCGTEKVVSDVVTMFREGSYLHEERDAEDWVLLFSMSVSSESGPRASDGVGDRWALNASVDHSGWQSYHSGSA